MIENLLSNMGTESEKEGIATENHTEVSDKIDLAETINPRKTRLCGHTQEGIWVDSLLTYVTKRALQFLPSELQF